MIGLLKNGDEIVIDAIKGEINVTLSDEEISPVFQTIIQPLKTELDASLRE